MVLVSDILFLFRTLSLDVFVRGMWRCAGLFGSIIHSMARTREYPERGHPVSQYIASHPLSLWPNPLGLAVHEDQRTLSDKRKGGEEKIWMGMSSLTRIVWSPDPETMSGRIHQEI